MPILPEFFHRLPLGKASAAILAVFLAACVSHAPPPALVSNQEEALAAARRGNVGTLTRLLESRATSPDTVDKNGDSLLILAVRDGYTEAAATVLRFRPKVDHCNRDGNSALMLAASQGDMKLLDLLLASGARTNPVRGENVWTALHYAALEGRLPAVKRLLAAGADINALTPNLSDALMLSARNGHIDIVRRLLKTPINLNRRNDREMTAEEWARSRGNTRIAALIAEARTARTRR